MVLRSIAAVVLLAAVASGCTTDPGPTDPPATSSPAAVPATPTETSEPLPSSVETAECAAGPGRSVEQLPDVTVPAVEVPAVAVEVAGERRTAIEGFTIPAQLVDAGCVVTYDAPGGCLGAVEITAARIPAVTLPGATLPEVELDDGTRAAERTFAPVTIPAASRPAVRTEQVCQVERDGELPTVTRAGVVREGFSRPGGARPGGTRGQECGEAGCVSEVQVPAVRVEPVRLPDVDVEPGRLESRELAGEPEVEVLTGEGTTVSYVAPGDVLFDSDEFAIRPDARRALAAIGARIRADAPVRQVVVEGHTDDRGDETYGLRLSERRAAAVADWLVDNAEVPRAVIRTRGLGETAPAASNETAAGRQENRRVVITVTR